MDDEHKEELKPLLLKAYKQRYEAKKNNPNNYRHYKLHNAKVNSVNPNEIKLLDEGYQHLLDVDPKYSLEPDPKGLLNLTREEKNFVKYYVQFKNVPSACKLCGIDENIGFMYFTSYNIQNEIRRINLAMYSRQFSSKMLGIDEIGGYLTSLIVDENVAIADRLSSKDKLSATKMLIELNELKMKAYENPTVLEATDFDEQIKTLSVASIKQLISSSKKLSNVEDKDKIIEKMDEVNDLTMEDKAYLKTLSKKDLIELLNTMTGVAAENGKSNET